jgi:3-dehydrosphinganine reductase
MALAKRGHPIALIAQDPDRLTSAAQTLRRSGAVVKTRSVDVGDRLSATQAIDQLAEEHGAPAWLINSAGIAEPGLFLDQPLSSHESQLRTNFLGTLYLTHATARHMANAGEGRIVVVSSGAGFYGIYGYAAYAPSKFAVRGLAEVLRVELAPYGISVTAAFPPDTRTPQLEYEERTKPAITKQITAGGGIWEPEDVAEKIIAGALAGRFAVTPGLPTTLLAKLHSSIGPILRYRQRRLLKRLRTDSK